MTTFESAKKEALKLRRDVDFCMEYEKAYVFSKKNDISIGGEGPVVILKDSGKAINMVEFCNMHSGELIREEEL